MTYVIKLSSLAMSYLTCYVPDRGGRTISHDDHDFPGEGCNAQDGTKLPISTICGHAIALTLLALELRAEHVNLRLHKTLTELVVTPSCTLCLTLDE